MQLIILPGIGLIGAMQQDRGLVLSLFGLIMLVALLEEVLGIG